MAKDIAKYLAESNINISKNWLMFGSIKPDFTNDSVSHFKKDNLTNFCQKYFDLQELNPEENLRDFSLKLGELFHYIADYFCQAHNEAELINKKLSHFKYEWQLNKFAKKLFERSSIDKLSDDGVYDMRLSNFINYKHQDYLKRKQSFKNDLDFTFKVCILMTKKLVKEISYNNNFVAIPALIPSL